MSLNNFDPMHCGAKLMRKVNAGLMGVAALALGAAVLPAALWADAGPAARAVRLSSVDGQVQLSQNKEVLAASAVANTPLFEGTNITTAEDGRAEVQFEDGSVARLSPNSSMTLSTLRGSGANGEAVITLDGGLGYFELQGAGQIGTIKVQFGDSVVDASGFTVMRISLDTPPGELAVFSGNAHLERGSALTVDLHGGESLALNGSDASRYTISENIEPDSWDSWNSDRDQVLTSEAAAKTGASKDYGDAGNPAWNDLDANGNWYNVPGQGNIWSPYEAANPNWDPYGNGAWGMMPGYGYSWISANSWGYLPYQCGMWNWYDSFGWGWAPGASGCSPWWGGGGYYGPNIGIGYGGYRPPLRPHPPRHPLRGYDLVAVNRRSTGPHVTLPARNRGGVVNIAGHPVMPIHSVNSRPVYEHTASGFVNHTVISNGGERVGVNGSPARSVGPTFGGNRSGGSAGFRSSGAGAVAHGGGGAGVSAASHGGGGFSGGGGGGGGGHASGGGGGHH
jgi:hypothetical protein